MHIAFDKPLTDALDLISERTGLRFLLISGSSDPLDSGVGLAVVIKDRDNAIGVTFSHRGIHDVQAVNRETKEFEKIWPREVSKPPSTLNDQTYLEKHNTGSYQIYEDLSISSEVEMCDFLYGLVRYVKPELIFEDGAGVGHGTAALGRACKDNGKGRVVACENNEAYHKIAVERTAGLPVDVQLQSTPCCPVVEEADFIFADGDYENRIKCFNRARAGCLFVVHDTRIEKPLEDLVAANRGLLVNVGRGFGIIQK